LNLVWFQYYVKPNIDNNIFTTKEFMFTGMDNPTPMVLRAEEF